jgi:predicted RNase H-like nuclease (RuvC/YqgF family)
MDPQLVTLIIALAGGIGAVLSFIAGRRERRASAMSDEGSAAVQISEGYMKLVTALEKRVESLEKENKELKECVEVLESERSELKHTVQVLETRLEKVENLTNGHGEE